MDSKKLANDYCPNVITDIYDVRDLPPPCEGMQGHHFLIHCRSSAGIHLFLSDDRHGMVSMPDEKS